MQMYFFGIVQKHTIAKGETLAIKGEFPKRPINVLLVFVTACEKIRGMKISFHPTKYQCKCMMACQPRVCVNAERCTKDITRWRE